MVERRFEWDETKRRRNRRVHGIDFADVARCFDGPSIDMSDEEHSAQEDRWRRMIAVGNSVAVVVYTERRSVVQLISARHANREEAELYWGYWFGQPE